MKRFSKFIYFFLFFLSTLCSAFSQIKPLSPERRIPNAIVAAEILNRKADSLNAPYLRYEKMLQYHDPVLYLTVAPQFNSIQDRAVPLQDAEGENGYWLEGNFAHRIVLYRGKYYSPSYLRKLRFTFDAAFMLRMTRDKSSPLLPTSDDVGLGADYLISSVDKVDQPGMANFWVKAQIHHYSNGQAGPFFLSTSPRRNNYKNGDFSTNYFRIMGYGMINTKNDFLLTGGIGYQREINIGGPLTLSDELVNSFGLNRAMFFLQIHRKSRFDMEYSDNTYTKITARSQFSARAEFNYIIDRNLSLFPTDHKYRISCNTYLTWMPYVTSDIGLVFHGYIGRDYLNIRYDDIIASYQLGLVMNFAK